MMVSLLIFCSAFAGSATFYFDGDSDTYGDPALFLIEDSLAVVPDYVQVTGDCDDNNDTAHPAALELCNGRDDDCDGVVDNGAACGCTHGTFGDRAFQFCQTTLNFQQAESACVGMDYNLAHVEGPGDNAYLYATAVTIQNQRWWIGLHDKDVEDTFEWNDGSTSNYRNWGQNQPNNAGNTQHCVEINESTLAAGTWNDAQCNGSQSYVCNAPPDLQVWFLDADGDGFGDADQALDSAAIPAPDYVLDSSDCDDTNAAIHPGAVEITCDMVDNDCWDGTVDEPDEDGDTFTVCRDCDDNNPFVSPGSNEVDCDGVDNDCEVTTTDGVDYDLDGVNYCTDCDDDEASIFPGNSEVHCNGQDDDCDVDTLDEPPDQDADGQLICDGDCDDNDDSIYTGAVEIADNGIDEDCDGSDLVTGQTPDGSRQWTPEDGGTDSTLTASGCDCDASGATPSWLWFSMLTLAVFRRRPRP